MEERVADDPDGVGLGTTFGYLYWYGYHVPAVRNRDLFYAKLEAKRDEDAGTV